MLNEDFETIQRKINSAVKALQEDENFKPKTMLVATDIEDNPDAIKQYVEKVAYKVYSRPIPEAQVAAFIATIRSIDESATIKVRTTMIVPKENEVLLEVLKDKYNWNYFEVLVNDKRKFVFFDKEFTEKRSESALGEFKYITLEV